MQFDVSIRSVCGHTFGESVLGLIGESYAIPSDQSVCFCEYWAAFWNTIFLTLPTVLLALGIGSLAAYGLRIINKKLSAVLLAVYAILSTLPAQILLVPHLVVLSSLFLQAPGLR